jgi:hypothetical protein
MVGKNKNVDDITKNLIRGILFDQEEPRIRIKMKKGTIIYLVSTEWFLVWVRYMQIYGCNEVVFCNEQEEEFRYSEDSITQQLNQHWITRPSKINNMPLIDEYEEDILPNLVMFKDVVPLPEHLWRMFQEVYGGGPEIRRVYP